MSVTIDWKRMAILSLIFILGILLGWNIQTFNSNSDNELQLDCFVVVSPLTNSDKSVILSHMVLSCTQWETNVLPHKKEDNNV